MESFSQEQPRNAPLPLDISSLVSFASAVAPLSKLTDGSVVGVNKHILLDMLEEKRMEESKQRFGFEMNAMGLIPMAFVSLMISMLIDQEMMNIDFLLDNSTDYSSDLSQ